MPMEATTQKPSSLQPIQGLWIGTLSLLEKLSMQSFLDHGHEYHLYTYEALSDVPKGVILKDASEIIPRENIFQYQRGQAKGGYSGFANLFRYHLLALKGGWWCDTDVICLKPFDFVEEIVLASERHWLWPNKICNAVMRCPAGHPLVQACYHDALKCDPKTMKFAANGEPILRRHVRKLKLEQFIQPPEVFNPIDWYRSQEIAQEKKPQIPDKSYAIHCYRETWRWRLKQHQSDQFRNRLFPETTLLGSLQHRYLSNELH